MDVHTSTHSIWIKGDDTPVTSREGERVIAALERSRMHVRVGCRRGGCGVCRVRVVSGEYTSGRMSRAHISRDEEIVGYALCCQIVARSDLVLELACSDSVLSQPATVFQE